MGTENLLFSTKLKENWAYDVTDNPVNVKKELLDATKKIFFIFHVLAEGAEDGSLHVGYL